MVTPGKPDTFYYLQQDGELDGAIALRCRIVVRDRHAALMRMRATGDMSEHVALAETALPGLAPRDMLRLAHKLLDRELKTLGKIQQREPWTEMSDYETAASPMPTPIGDTSQSEKAIEGAQQQSSISLNELFDRWENETHPSASTLSSWRGITRHLSNHLDRRSLNIAKITPDDIVRWKDGLVAANKSAATISNGYLACAKALFGFAVANKLRADNPAEGVKLSRKKKAGTKMLGYTRQEVETLLALASAETVPWKRWLHGWQRQQDRASAK